MEPSRCKTTSTVTLACKFRPRQEATSKVSGSTIFQTQYMTYIWKDKILAFSHTKEKSNTHLLYQTRSRLKRRGSLCADRDPFFIFFFYYFLQSFHNLIHFCKAEAVISWMVLKAQQSLWWGPQLSSVKPPHGLKSDWLRLERAGRKANILLYTTVIIT